MKKIWVVCCALFVALSMHAGISPVQLELYGQTYCSAAFTWYYYGENALAIGLFRAEAGAESQLVAGIVATTAECDYIFAETDQIKFPNTEENIYKYYCSTYWILNASSLQQGAAWASSVMTMQQGNDAYLALREGSYYVQIYETDGSSMTAGSVTLPFTLTDKHITNLQTTVAGNKTTATLTWDTPALDNGEWLYVSVRSGETVAYDNYASMATVTSPLTLNVEEGKSYTATVLIADANKNPMGTEVATDFTVGTNNYEPTNVHAEVFGGDNVTFSWEVVDTAAFYDIVLSCDGEYYTTLSVRTTTKTTTMPKDGTWSWTVQAFTQGTSGKYFPASNAIAGNDFVSKAADIPEDAIVMNVWGMEAGYLDQYVDSFPENKYGWMIMFATGEEGGTGMPMPYFLIYTDKEDAISGVYNVARGNLDIESCYLNTNGTPAGCVMATDAEVRLQFDGYDDDKAAKGYRYGYFTGQFRLVATDGKTYVGKFMDLFCNSFNYSTAGGIRDHKGLWDEDPDYIVPYQSIESVSLNEEETARKILLDGQLYILRGNAIYNASGMRVR